MNAVSLRWKFFGQSAVLPLLLGASGLLASCASYIEQRAASAILEALPQAVGAADHYEAIVHGPNANATHFDQVHAVGFRVRRERAPVLDRIEADFQDVTIDRQAKRVTAIGAANGTLRLKASDLADYLRQPAWIEEPAVRFEGMSQVIISGRLKVPGLALTSNSTAEFRGVLAPRESQMVMRVESLRYGDRQAPSIALGFIEQLINPVFDVARNAVPSHIDAVMVEGDTLVINASWSQLELPIQNVGTSLRRPVL
jgi:LmeA-like phospholipid-binding